MYWVGGSRRKTGESLLLSFREEVPAVCDEKPFLLYIVVYFSDIETALVNRFDDDFDWQAWQVCTPSVDTGPCNTTLNQPPYTSKSRYRWLYLTGTK